MRYFLLGIVAVLCFGACDDFLEEYSQDLTYARTLSDLEELLIGSAYVPTQSAASTIDGLKYMPWLHLMDDDIKGSCIDREGLFRTKYREFYLWGSYPWMQNNEAVKDPIWPELYNRISVVNVILKKLDEIDEGTLTGDRLRGECHFLRAFYYYFLVNVYAKPYSKVSATQELGVPVKLTEYIEDIYFSRNTIEETYNQIVKDLKDAIHLLKNKEEFTIYQANYYAACALLSRVSLYIGNFETTIQTADSVILSGRYNLLDYNLLPQEKNTQGTDINMVDVIYASSPETIFSQGINVFSSFTGFNSKNNFKVSDDLVNILHKENDKGEDLRYLFSMYVYNYMDPDKRYPMKKATMGGEVVSSEWLIKYPEVLLNKIEALVSLHREEEAIKIIEELRKKRVAEDEYKPLDIRSGESLMEFVRDERRRELCFEGHRWFDIRRYAVHPVYPFSKEIVHEDYYYNNTLQKVEYLGSYVLKKYNEDEAYYVLPIPRHVIEFNKGNMVDNDYRKQKSVL